MLKQGINKFLEKTGDPEGLPFKLHDFGYRGASSEETASIGGAAHLVNFMGTDTIAGIRYAREFYEATMPGHSIPAAEHSTITSWGKSHEADAFSNILTQYGSGPYVAVVSDSYDIHNACKHIWGESLKEAVLDFPGTVMVRLDSGDPEETAMRAVSELGERFGYTENKKGFKVLDPHIRIIQADGVNSKSVMSILHRFAVGGWSADNISFGMGSSLIQDVTRDDLNFAFKCSSIIVNGEERSVLKSPVGQPMKKSKAGRFYSDLREVFRDGKLLIDDNFDTVRKRAAI